MGNILLALLEAIVMKKTYIKGYNPPPMGAKCPDKPTPAPPPKLYDKLGRPINRG